MLQAVNRGCRPMLCHHADWVAAFLHGQPGVSDWNSALKLGFEPATECWPDWLLAQVRTCTVPVSGHAVPTQLSSEQQPTRVTVSTPKRPAPAASSKCCALHQLRPAHCAG